MISHKAVNQFKETYKEVFGTELSDQEATELSISLLTLFDAIYRPVKREWTDELGQRQGRKE